ncbi:Permease of the drug/metabolite transporter (DMT) superfamily [Chitinophaga sp. CF118]|uniref:EamA family transporter n=1 Tax=Chitinophaga sp. CF118 TaxID=1884367 RepID=UPI0008EA065F|nr:EamA family transporter [Chitinophaga sp. CF118]SFD58695.1 Permease of the drug/metabolite transporter (DMT) superfamily [Chitinophaga sp. CF118]
MSLSQQKNAPPLLVIIAFATIYIVWGSTYFFIGKAVQGGLPPFLLAFMRYFTAGLLLMLWCIIRGEKIFIWKNIIHATVSGILLLFIANGTVTWSEQILPSAMVAIIVSCPPLWIVLLDYKNWKINLRNKSTVTGLIIGFIGVLLLFGEQVGNIFSTGGDQSRLPWMLLLLFGTLGFASGSLYFKYNVTTGSAAVNTSWQMLTTGILFIPASFIHQEFNGLDLKSIPGSSWFSLLYLIFLGSIAAFSAYVWLLQVRPATQVSTYAYVNPVLAVILGVLFAHEHISWMQISGLFVILGSVLLINLSKYRKEKQPKVVKSEELELIS